MNTPRIQNALTVDVEEYFHVSNFEGIINRDHWDRQTSRLEPSMDRLLAELEASNIRATFFILGWIARKYPTVVKRVHTLGHEVASHGSMHELVYSLTPGQFRRDVIQTKDELENIIGERVAGYRAPSYSITRESWWALEILHETGHLYDSSIFPIRHYRYGIPGYHRFPHQIDLDNGNTLWEFPISTCSLFGSVLPISGGAYLRFLPEWFVRHGLRRINKKENQPFLIYFHPWEIDPDQPRIKANILIRVNHYFNIHKMMGKLRSLFKEHHFVPLKKILELDED